MDDSRREKEREIQRQRRRERQRQRERKERQREMKRGRWEERERLESIMIWMKEFGFLISGMGKSFKISAEYWNNREAFLLMHEERLIKNFYDLR